MIWAIKVIEDGAAKWWTKPGISADLQAAHRIRFRHDRSDEAELVAETVRDALSRDQDIQTLTALQQLQPAPTHPTIQVEAVPVSLVDGVVSEGVPDKTPITD